LVVSSDKTASLHFETEAMAQLIKALEITPPSPANLVR
jgi:hypothetical protein